MVKQKITLLIDGNNTIHRAHWIAKNPFQGSSSGTVEPLVNSKGVDTGTIFTFLRTIKSYTTQFNADRVYIIWDKKIGDTNQKNFRETSTDGTYKAGRNLEYNKEVYAHTDKIVEITTALGIRNMFPSMLEGDDLISWCTKNIDGKKIIISVDKDFIQLVDENVAVFSPIKKILTDHNNFFEIFKLTPRQYLYFKAIKGDQSDNIVGITGYGEKKGYALAKKYDAYVNPTLESESLSEDDIKVIKANKTLIESNIRLTDLSYALLQYKDETDMYYTQYQQLSTLKINPNQFKQLCIEYEFASILNKFDDWIQAFNRESKTDTLIEFFKQFE